MSNRATNKLIISGESCYPCDDSKGPIHAAHEADRAGYQFVAHKGKIYAIVRFADDRHGSLYLCECETEEETTAEVVAEFNQIQGTEENRD